MSLKRQKIEISSMWIYVFMLVCLIVICLPGACCSQNTCSSMCYRPTLHRTIELNYFGNSDEKCNQTKKKSKSKTWSFCNKRGGNVTLEISEKHLSLKGKDCVEGGPYVKIDLTGSTGGVRKICDKRTTGFNLPMVGSQCVNFSLCEGVKGSSFQYAIKFLIAGYIDVREIPAEFHVEKSRNLQWMVFQGLPKTFTFEFSNIKFTRNKKCKRAYIKLSKAGKNEELEKICPENNNYNTTKIMELINSPETNVSFKHVKFDLFITKPKEIIYPRTTETKLKAQTFSRNPSVRPQDERAVPTTQQKSNNFLENLPWIGLALAVMFVILAVIVVGRKFYQRHKKDKKRKQLEGMEISVYNEGKELTVPNKQQSMNNAMYEKVIDRKNAGGTRKRASTEEQATIIIHSTNRDGSGRTTSPLLAEEDAPIDKKQLRLSQLADKYIDVEIANSARAKNTRNFQLTSKNNLLAPPLHQTPSKSRLRNSASFRQVRAPVPPPATNKLQIKNNDNDYESIHSPLPEKDSIPPAYVTVVEDPENKWSEERRFDFSSDAPIAQYVSNNMNSQKKLSCDVYVSSESLQNVFHSPIKQGLEQTGSVGYLTPTSTESINISEVAYSEDYVTANNVTKKSLQLHNKKPVPRPGRNDINLSLPNLTNDNDKGYSSLLTPPNQQSKQRIRERLPSPAFDSHNSKIPKHIATSKQYNQPRPSVPDIFIKCAYTSGETISQIRQNIEKRSPQVSESTEVDYDHPSQPASIHGSETSEQFMYDSPRPSIDSSRDSILEGMPTGYYHTPRPSLPIIFPDDYQKPTFLQN